MPRAAKLVRLNTLAILNRKKRMSSMRSWQILSILMVHQQKLMVIHLFINHHFQRHAILMGNQQCLEHHTSNLGSLLIQISKPRAEDIKISIRASIGLTTTYKEGILLLIQFLWSTVKSCNLLFKAIWWILNLWSRFHNHSLLDTIPMCNVGIMLD